MGNHVQALVILFLLEVAACDLSFKSVTVDSFKNENAGDSYEFSYTLSDGQSRSEKGVRTQQGDAQVYEVKGSYSFKAPDGKIHVAEYSSGVNGYKVTVKDIESTPNEQIFNPTVLNPLIG